MTFFSRNRKIFLCAAILLVAGIGFFFINARYAEAQITGALGSAVNAFTKTAQGSVGVGIAYGLLYVLFLALNTALVVVGFFMDNLFAFNLTWNLTSPPLGLVANQGWTIMRDLTNGLFILILLWIAITIIFNIEQLGGKKFLIRVIIAALLINFSFAMVSAVFGFANILTKPFYTPLKINQENTLSKIIVGSSYIHEVADQISKGGVESYTRAIQQQKSIEAPPESGFAQLWRSLGTPQEAHAALPLLVWLGLTAAGALAGALVTAVTAYAVIPLILNLIIADTFLALMVVAFASISIILALRIVAMIFLAIFAPIAFVGYMTPRYGERFWNDWLRYLFNWAFIAPVFYFLIYLSLFVLTQMSQLIPQEDVSFNGSLLKMFNLALFIIFLFAAIRITRKMGGAIAETALTLGKQVAGLGLGIATGGLALGARTAARRLAPQLQKVMGAPILRQTTLARRTGAYLERQKNLITPHERELEGFSDDYLAQEYSRSVRAERKVAIANLLAKRGELTKLRGEQVGALNLAAQFGPASALNILKARPDLATPELLGKVGMKNADNTEITTPEQAFAAVIKKIGTGDAANISNEVFARAKNPDGTDGAYTNEGAIKALWQELRPEHIQQIARNKPATASAMMEYLNANPEVVKRIKPEMYTYLSSNASQGIGLRLPATHEKPQAIVEQDIRAIAAEVVAEQARYTEQESRADRHARAGNAPDEARARVDMQIIKDKLDVLNNKIDAMEEELRDNGVKVLSLQKNPLSIATEDRLYAGDILPVGGTGPYQVEILEGGPLPRGLEFNEPTGRIVGTPTAAAVGRHRLVIRIKDSAGAQSVPRPIVLEIKPK